MKYNGTRLNQNENEALSAIACGKHTAEEIGEVLFETPLCQTSGGTGHNRNRYKTQMLLGKLKKAGLVRTDYTKSRITHWYLVDDNQPAPGAQEKE